VQLDNILANPVNIVVLGWLGIYLFFVFFIFFYKYLTLSSWIKNEEESLNTLLMSKNFSIKSSLKNCIENKLINKYSFNACIEAAKKKANSFIIFLSIVASTAPFIGLFGTVIGILEAFNSMEKVTTINMIAPSIADALIATAVGIVTAVPAYSFHQILSKKVEDLITILKIQRDVYLADEKA
jgi:biopolymer transport protein ExbB/TolQ